MKLPKPDNLALAHSRKVEQYIADKIQQSGGSIPFSEYMEHVLYAPGLGYYSAGCIKFGEQGDFITAPEISPLFSRCIALAMTPVLQQLKNKSIFEVGAGSGKMAAAILNELHETNIKLDQYFILERSAELRERQQQTIEQIVPNLLDKVHWLDSLPSSFTGVVVANELLDAMPIQRFKKRDEGIAELHVAYNDGKFIWQEIISSNARLLNRISKIELQLEYVFPEGYIGEVNFAAEDWLASINDILETGYILLIDYGYPEKEYYHEQRNQGTMNCFYQHVRHEDPFLYPGLQDITAHVDFSNLTDAALNMGNVNSDTSPAGSLQLNGYTTQAQFLMASGLMEIVQTGMPEGVKQQLMQSQEIKKLTMPYEMGEIVKVIGFEKGLSNSEHSKELNLELPCFSMRDLRYQL